MKTFKIYGASDDLIETEGCEGCDEFGAYSHGREINGKLLLTSGEFVLRILCIYSGFWSFGIGPDSHDHEVMPPWEIRRSWGKDCRYSETVEIDVPDDAILHRIGD